MRRASLCFSWVFLIPFLLISLDTFLSVTGQCLSDQKAFLQQFRSNLLFNSSISTKLQSWNPNTDCCNWGGVDCNPAGQVIGIDLNSESISGGIGNSGGGLFALRSLQKLNLANNNFSFTSIPSGFGNLTSLTHLNLSNSLFSGQIPRELSSLTRLVVLDLSSLFAWKSLKLENPSLAVFVQNFNQLTELYLDGVNIAAARGNEWGPAISNSLPNLSVLSMSSCNLSGPIDESFGKLNKSLSIIRLSLNKLSTEVPEFFANFKNLTVLRLSSCHLNGKFPEKIFQLPTLQILDLANNELVGSLPHFLVNGSLQSLVLSHTNFSGEIPDSIGNLGMLSRLELPNSNFSGPIPPSIQNLTHLTYLDLSSNNFRGSIPSFQSSKNLTHIDLSHNGLSGPIQSSHFDGLQKLVYVDLRLNSLNGSIPHSLFSLPLVQKIQLSNNKFSGPLPEFPNASASPLDTLDLSSNNMTGSIPTSFFDLQMLNILTLSSNSLSGTISVEKLKRLRNLTSLDLSYNRLSIEISINSSLSSFPPLTTMKLAHCNLTRFPNLRNQSRLVSLDLSDNQIKGEIPNWIWEAGSGSLSYLNLSCNQLDKLQEPYHIPNLNILDLHSNQLTGEIPIPPQTATYVDYSSNQFSSQIPVAIGSNLTFAYFFSLANNSIVGKIPDTICNASYLQVLDLSNNSLNGSIPLCLFEESVKLGVLNLAKNDLDGNIEGTFPNNCGLRTLDLHGNRLEGTIPKSLENCTVLEVLNLGNNMINDTFPCFLKNVTNLRVLVLRSNKLHGSIVCHSSFNISWEKLQIIDIASNGFTGPLPKRCFLNWKAMMTDEDAAQSEYNHLRFEFLQLNQFYYQDGVTVTNKGLEMELAKILTIFTSIDISNNKFVGVIPDTIGKLQALYVLNASSNEFNGSIPPSIGNLSQLGSLDLSNNDLTGAIPPEIARLTFLSVLNLSYNQLEGRIPTGPQIQTFEENSFEGNKGLCGDPLKNKCPSTNTTPAVAQSPEEFPGCGQRFDWQFIFTGLGFGMGAGVVVGPFMFWKEGRDSWNRQTDKLVDMILLALGIKYTCDIINETEENVEEEESEEDGAEDKDDSEDVWEGKASRGRYCVFCSKLDLYRREAIHDPKCTCHNLTPPLSSSSSSSSYTRPESPFTKF